MGGALPALASELHVAELMLPLGEGPFAQNRLFLQRVQELRNGSLKTDDSSVRSCGAENGFRTGPHCAWFFTVHGSHCPFSRVRCGSRGLQSSTTQRCLLDWLG